jgi:uncharacterized membrane protein YbhN (UPF0104 family)
VTSDTEHGLDLGSAARRGALFAVVAVVVAIAVSTLPGVDDVRDRLADADPIWLVGVVWFAIGSMLGYVRALWAVFDRVLPWRRALVLGLAEQGANVLIPAGGAGGPALGAYVMQRIGVPGELAAKRHAALFLATSAVSFFAMALFGTLTSVGLLPSDASLPWRLIPAVGATALIVLSIVYARLPSPVERAHGRISGPVFRVRLFVHDGVRMTYHLLRHGDRFLAVGAITYFACDVASLACAFQAFGGGAPPLGDFVLAYTLGHAGAFLPTPGGIGGVEGGLIGMFVIYGAPVSVAAAAVLGYRVFQLGLPAIVGAVCLLRVRHVLAHPPPREEVEARFAALER